MACPTPTVSLKAAAGDPDAADLGALTAPDPDDMDAAHHRQRQRRQVYGNTPYDPRKNTCGVALVADHKYMTHFANADGTFRRNEVFILKGGLNIYWPSPSVGNGTGIPRVRDFDVHRAEPRHPTEHSEPPAPPFFFPGGGGVGHRYDQVSSSGSAAAGSASKKPKGKAGSTTVGDDVFNDGDFASNWADGDSWGDEPDAAAGAGGGTTAGKPAATTTADAVDGSTILTPAALAKKSHGAAAAAATAPTAGSEEATGAAAAATTGSDGATKSGDAAEESGRKADWFFGTNPVFLDLGLMLTQK